MSLKPISDQKLLEVKNVVAHYRGVQALSDISFDIGEGMIVGLIGANGAGKSTILKIISGLMKPTSGSIWFHKNRLDKLPAHKIVELGIVHVPEGRRLFTKLSVIDNLKIGSYIVRDDKITATAMEKAFHYFPILRERRYQAAKLLSGGEQQMLAIARGLMSQPKLLLLDEPTLGLSPIMSIQIGQVITDINKEGITIILAEQNARLALRLSHEAYVFETGKLTLQGTREELVHNEEVIKAYLSA